jgi:hypothetical protein
MMKTLHVPRIMDGAQMDDKYLRETLVSLGAHGEIAHQQWNEYRRPVGEITVNFSLGYEGTDLFVLYSIREPELRAVHRSMQDPVFEDSCVELFISDPENTRYINLEFNALGACLCGIGEGRANRRLLPEKWMQNLGIWSSYLEGLEFGIGFLGAWELLARIPLGTCGLVNDLLDLGGTNLRANFYKCGDKLRFPHYISWNEIDLPNPDFHQSRFFGSLHFVS